MNQVHRTVHRRKRTLAGALVLALACLALPALAGDAPQGKVNVNSAGVEQLTLLPRIGTSTAGRIAEFREENGPFEAKEDLLLVRGIGEKTYALLEPYVTLEGETTLTEKVRVSRIRASEESAESGESDG